MRFSVAMDSLEKENKFLKLTVVSFFLLIIGLSIGVLKVSTKSPLIIERGCLSRIVAPTAGETNKDEVQAFLELALAERFNSKFSGTVFLSEEQQIARVQEQKELNRLSMTQKVILNDVDISGKKITALADRLISTGDIRSGFKWPLDVELLSVTRSESNPYGLILIKVTPLTDTIKKEAVPSK